MDLQPVQKFPESGSSLYIRHSLPLRVSSRSEVSHVVVVPSGYCSLCNVRVITNLSGTDTFSVSVVEYRAGYMRGVVVRNQKCTKKSMDILNRYKFATPQILLIIFRPSFTKGIRWIFHFQKLFFGRADQRRWRPFWIS